MPRGSDSLPEIEPIDLEPPEPPTPVVVRGGTRSRWKVGIALLVVAVIAGFALVSDDDPPPSIPPDDRELDPSDPTPSTASTVPVVSILGDERGPVLDAPVGASLLIGSEEGWRSLDLDTSELVAVPALEGVDRDEMVPVRGGVVVLGSRGLVRIAVPGGQRTSVVFTAADRIVGLYSSGDPDSVWVVYRDGRTQGGFQLGLDGLALTDSIDLPGVPRGAVTSGIVVSAGGRTYLAGEGGVRPLADGEVLATAGDLVAVLECDAEVTCAAQVIDTSTGATRQGPVVDDAGSGTAVVVLADDGSLAALPFDPSASNLGGSTLPVSITTDGATNTIEVDALVSRPVWLPDGRGMVMLTGSGLSHTVHRDGVLLTETVAGGLRTLTANHLIVIEHP